MVPLVYLIYLLNIYVKRKRTFFGFTCPLRTLLEYCKLFKISTTEDQEDQPKQDGIYDSECPKPSAD